VLGDCLECAQRIERQPAPADDGLTHDRIL
jgi:hypothetical protein